MKMRIRRISFRLLLAVSLIGASVFPSSASEQLVDRQIAVRARDVFKGKPLSEALLTLQGRGLAIVFTSELVRPEMKVLVEPGGGSPRQILDEILAPHRLQVREGGGGVLVVVPMAADKDQSLLIQGTVLDRSNRRGVAGATVRIVEIGLETTALADGSFSFDAPGPARYTLEAKADGHLEQRIADVLVSAKAPRKVVFRLYPQNYLEDAIVVQPSRLSLLLDKPESSFSLSREEIESLPHLGGDVFRTTSLLPGVAAGDVTAEFSVHGGRRDEVRILLDGQEIYGTYHLKDYDNALSIVHAQTLAGATLTTGAYPVSQGDRMSGVFDMRTVDPEAGQHFVLGVSILDSLASGSGRFASGRGAWLLAARRGSLTFARNAIGGEHPSFWDVFGKAEVSTGFGSISARVLAASDKLVVDKSDVDGFDRFKNTYDNFYAWVTHQATVGQRFLIETNGSLTQIDNDRGGSGDDRQQLAYHLKDQRTLQVVGLSQTWTASFGERHLARWGFEARRYDAFFDYSKVLAPHFVVVVPFSPPRSLNNQFHGTVRGDHLGLWGSDRISLSDHITAEVGLRYDRHTATDETLLSPRINLGYRVGDQGVIRAAWGRFFQSQRPYELQVEDGVSKLRKAELSQHSVLGYERFFRQSRLGIKALRLELFDRKIDDPRPRYESLLEPVNVFPETEPDRARIAPDRSTARGVEMLVRGSGGGRFDWWLAYSYSRAQDRIAGKTVARSLDEPHVAVLDMHFRLPKQWDLNLAGRYRTGWPTTPVNAGLVEDPAHPGQTTPAAVFGPLNSDRFPSYHRLDLRASRRWAFRSGGITFFVDVQNAYNRHNTSGFDLTLDTESDTVNLRREFWPRTFPSLGITWEF
ncbi:MAG TPA: TonB-dependent receptor [Thermoanaerobaculia bacterium]|nr:TonB-dependent receptor [Thermoanaerobaculia bacterium]